jgi:signal transduction histidine kinase
LRTPLAILIAETQRILKRDRTPEEYKDVIQTCQSAATSMSELVESLLLLARQDSEGAEKHYEPCDLGELAHGVATTHAPLAAGKSIEFVSSLQAAPCVGDPVALRILISNLMANAVQHHHGGGHVWLESGVKDGDAFLTVRDDGPGIPEEDLPRVFERFYRVDKARSRTAGHSGLGLSIVKAIAENHGAQIVGTAEVGKGTTFELRIPRLGQDTAG